MPVDPNKTQAQLLDDARNVPYDKLNLGGQMRVILNYLIHQYPLEDDGTKVFTKAQAKQVRIRRKVVKVHQSKDALVQIEKEPNPPDRVTLNAIAEAVIQLILHEDMKVDKVVSMSNHKLVELALPHYIKMKADGEERLRTLIEQNPDSIAQKFLKQFKFK